MKLFKVLWINALVLLSLLFLMLLGGEVYYRFIYDSTDSFALTHVTKRWLRENYQFNGSGYRDDHDYFHNNHPGKIRITFLGDSFTAGHGIEEIENRFVNHVRRSKPEWDIDMFAKNGVDTGAEIEMIDEAIRMGYQFDRVVLIYCLNDIADIVPEWLSVAGKIYNMESNQGFLARHSYFVNMLYYRQKAFRDPDISRYYHFVRAAYEGQPWITQQKRLSLLNEKITARGGKLLVVTFPFLQSLGARYEYQGVHEKLNRFWEEQKIPHLDLYDTFNKFSPKQLTVNRFDAHPNELAHDLAAHDVEIFIASETAQRKKRE